MRVGAFIALFIVLAGCAVRPAPPVAEGESFKDSFDDPSHEFPGWEVRSGAWELVDEATAPSEPHALEQKDASSEAAVLLATGFGTFGSVDVRVSLRTLPTATQGAGVLVRFVDAENYYLVRTGAPGGTIILEEYRGGNATELQRGTRSFESPMWGLLGIRIQADRFTVTMDGEQVFSAVDPTLSVGEVGLWTPPGARAQFDDVDVTRL